MFALILQPCFSSSTDHDWPITMQESSHCDQYNQEYGPLDVHVLTVSASCLRCIGLMFSDVSITILNSIYAPGFRVWSVH